MSPAHHHAGHDHAHAHERMPDPPWARRVTLALLVPAVVLTAIGMFLLWPRDVPQAAQADPTPRVTGEVVAVTETECPPLPDGDPAFPEQPVVCGTVTVRLSDGGQLTAEIPAGPGAPEVAPGDDVILLRLENAEGPTYSIVDHQRSTQLWLLGAVFALAVLAFGRLRGLGALAGLAVTFSVLLLFIVPAILDGRSPLLVAIIGAAAIMLTVLYLTHGFHSTTSVAVLGTLAALTITAALSSTVTAAVHLSGVADETSNYLTITQGDVNMRGL